MSYQQENSMLFSLDNLRSLAGAAPRRRRVATLGPREASFLDMAQLNRLDSSPSLHAASMLVAPTPASANRWLFPALVFLGTLLLFFSGLALVVVIKKHRAQHAPQLAAAITQVPRPPSLPEAAALAPAPVAEHHQARQLNDGASAPRRDDQPATRAVAPAASTEQLAKRPAQRKATARKTQRKVRQRALQGRRAQRKVRRSSRRTSTRIAARSTHKSSKKNQDLDSLLLGF